MAALIHASIFWSGICWNVMTVVPVASLAIMAANKIKAGIMGLSSQLYASQRILRELRQSV